MVARGSINFFFLERAGIGISRGGGDSMFSNFLILDYIVYIYIYIWCNYHNLSILVLYHLLFSLLHAVVLKNARVYVYV